MTVTLSAVESAHSDLLRQCVRQLGENPSRFSLFGILLALLGLLACQRHAEETAPPPLEVSYVEATSKDVAVYSEWIGTTQGLVTADVRPTVQGYLLKQTYQDGARVRVGEQLYGYPLKPGQRRVRSTHHTTACLWCVERTLLQNCPALSG